MASRPRRLVLRKIAARRRRSQRGEVRAAWTMFLASGVADLGHRARTPMFAGPRILTKRELEVLRLVATGETDRGIADALYVSRRTISSHVSNILAKLDVPSRRAAVIAAARIGLL